MMHHTENNDNVVNDDLVHDVEGGNNFWVALLPLIVSHTRAHQKSLRSQVVVVVAVVDVVVV